jgi:methanogenic corrinoid protein MtbC1
MVGGVLFSERPDLLSLIGADMAATDANDAVRKAAAAV